MVKKKAVGLSYKDGDVAPLVVAKGEGLIAQKIIEEAELKDITIYEDKNLVDSLIDLELKEEIPEELYEVVAEVIFYVFTIDKERKI